MTISSLIVRALNKLHIINRYNNRDIFPIHWFNLRCPITLNNSKSIIPVLNKTGWENLFLTDGWFTGILKYLNVKPDWTIVDVGANIGRSLLKIKSIDKEIRYFGFEPNPVCINYLENLIKANKFTDTTIYPIAVSNQSGIMLFYHHTSSQTDPSASIIPGYRPSGDIKSTHFVPVYKLKDIADFREIRFINLIKIDVEGAEIEVLESFKELINKFRPFIIVEVLPVYSSENIVRYERVKAIESFVDEVQYKIYLINKGRNESFESISLIDEIGIHNNILNIDYLLSPEITG
jgi:FkbM family methyltransferase